MLDINEIKNQFEIYKSGLIKRGIVNAAEILEKIINLNNERKELIFENDSILNELNLISKKVSKLDKIKDLEESENLRNSVITLKKQSKILKNKITHCNKEIKSFLINLPNIPHNDVPEESRGNQIVKNSKKYSYPSNSLPHWDIAKNFGLDFEAGAKITGTGFPVYSDQMAKFQRALINFFLDSAIKEGYKEMQLPLLVNEISAFSSGQLPDKEGLMYATKDDNFYLIPTSEVPLMNFYRDTVINIKDLPIKHVAYSNCFRREAGSWGSHVRGLNRLHQFDKVEIVQITSPQKSYVALEEMTLHVEGLLDKLNLEFRKVRLHAKDMGVTASLTYDYEVYSAPQKRWLEVSSVSNCEAYQANRLKLRIKDLDNNKIKAHTLNGSALALPRIVAAIVDNHQDKDYINVPKSLVSYFGSEFLKKCDQ